MRIKKYKNGLATCLKPVHKIVLTRKEARRIIDDLQAQINNGLPDRICGDCYDLEFLVEKE